MSVEAKRRGADIEIGAFAPRRFRDSEPMAPAYFKHIGIVQNPNRDPAVAWELIKWLFEPENTVAYHTYTNTLPSRHDVAAELVKAAPYMTDWYRVLNHYNLSAPMGLTGIMQAERETFLRALWGRIDLHEAINRINRRYQEYLDQVWTQRAQ